MPRRNLGSHVCYSHMIEPLGVRWCLGMCDVTHRDPFLRNLTSVLFVFLYLVSYLLILPRGYRANKVLVTREQLRGTDHVHHQLMHVRIMLMHLIHAYIKSIIILASLCMHHSVGIMTIASCHMHTISFVHETSPHGIAPTLKSFISKVHR